MTQGLSSSRGMADNTARASGPSVSHHFPVRRHLGIGAIERAVDSVVPGHHAAH